MKAALRTPFFEVGIKNYVYGDDVLAMAIVAEAAGEKYGVDIIFITPYTEIRRVCERAGRLLVFAPYMDTLRPGRGMADVLPEALKAAGAKGVVVNHCERPMTLPAIKQTIARADELDLLTFACADTIAEARAMAELRPDIINPEPSELIGSKNDSDMAYVAASIRAVKEIGPGIIVEQAAGVSSGAQVYDLIRAGAEGVGAASGIFKADDPRAMLDEMVRAVRRAADDMKTEIR